MNNNQTVAAGIAAALLGVTAAGALVFGVAVPLIVLNSQFLGGPASAAVVLVGVVSVIFGATAAFASWAVASARPVGTIVGLGVGVVTILGAAVGSASGGSHPALVYAFLLGGAVVAALLMALREQGSRAAG